jgi:hypothetical protein
MCLNESCITVRIGERMSDQFPIKSSLKQGDAILWLLFNFGLEYAIRMVYADDVNLKEDNIDIVKKQQILQLTQLSRLVYK